LPLSAAPASRAAHRPAVINRLSHASRVTKIWAAKDGATVARRLSALRTEPFLSGLRFRRTRQGVADVTYRAETSVRPPNLGGWLSGNSGPSSGANTEWLPFGREREARPARSSRLQGRNDLADYLNGTLVVVPTMEPATVLPGPINAAEAPLSNWIPVELPVTTLFAKECRSPLLRKTGINCLSFAPRGDGGVTRKS
jgi:hypothetical protein